VFFAPVENPNSESFRSYYDSDADLEILKDKRVVFLGPVHHQI
jgi:hypothetical protein